MNIRTMPSIRTLSIAALLLFAADITQCNGQILTKRSNLRYEWGRLLSEVDRHPNTVMENGGAGNDHPNAVTLRNSYFAAKFCAPDDNGYYGSTMGKPYVIHFGFEAETAPGADVDEVKNAVHEAIETALLTTFFPTMCQVNGIPYDSKVTGFHFDPDATQYARKFMIA